MSDPRPPDDELLSAHLDGELTGEERRALEERLEAEPALAARLGELRAAADLVATPVVPLAADRVDDLVGAALRAGTTSPEVTDLAAAGARRRARASRIAVAAAVVVLLVLAVPVLRAVDGGDDNETADAVDAGEDGSDAADGVDEGAAESAPAEADAAAATIEEAAPAADAAELDDTDGDDTFLDDAGDGLRLETEGVEAASADDLGRFDDLAQLRAAVVERYRTDPRTTTTTVGAPDTGDGDQDDSDGTDRDPAVACLVEVTTTARALIDRLNPPLSGLGLATLAGEPVVVAVFATDPGPTVVVATIADCAVVDAAVLD